ncbi:MAG: phospholipid carrier-dependent glycosyltransferase, partial [Nitrosopumilus sp.]|nr:phospholipid carrier-dependent glycosyltransferase [Nitrosopumilus sp.]
MMKLHFEKVTITHIILISLVLHAFVIPFPEDWLVFDESLFSWASRTLLEGEDRTPYQMPGLHVIGATAISLLGDDWFSLRVPVVIFGMLTLLVFYNICIHFTTRQNALLATTILSFDTIFFFHSQLFLRDVPMIFFGMMALYLYLNKRYYLAA